MCFDVDLLEYCNRLYQNFYFLIRKSNGKYQLINVVVFLNRVSVKDVNLPSLANKFLEKFDGMAVTLVVNLFLGYD